MEEEHCICLERLGKISEELNSIKSDVKGFDQKVIDSVKAVCLTGAEKNPEWKTEYLFVYKIVSFWIKTIFMDLGSYYGLNSSIELLDMISEAFKGQE